jgi:hypothetical protein
MRIRLSVLAVAFAVLMLVPAAPAAALGFGYDSQWSTGSYGADDIAVSVQGDVYAVFQDANEVRRYRLSGDPLGTFGSSILSGARGIATDRYGRVYVADTNSHRVAVFTRQGDVIGFIAEPENAYVYDVAVDFDCNVYLLDTGHTVHKFDADDWTTVVHSFPAGSNNVFAISSDLWSDLWFSLDEPGPLPYTTGNRIIGLDAAGGLLANVGSSGALDGQFDRPMQIGIDPMRRVYVADAVNNRVQVFGTSGTWLTTFGGLGSSREMTISALAEPSLMLAAFTVAIGAGSTGLTEMVNAGIGQQWRFLAPSQALAFAALFIVLIAETGRIPVDNPATHLELTMIHEAMILEYSGPYLALIEWGASIKQLVLMTLLINIFWPFGLPSAWAFPGVFAGLGYLLLKLALLACCMVLVETTNAKMRLFRVPELMAVAFTLGTLALVSTFLF